METYVFIVYTNIGDYKDLKVFDTLFKVQKELKESFEKILVSNVTVKSEEELR